MKILYAILSVLFQWSLPLIGTLSSKLRLFANGRKHSFSVLEKNLKKGDKVIWFHCASLGEYEQGVPVMESLKKEYPTYKLLVTFFSPSGYEAKKKSTLADVVLYLPVDTIRNAKRFVKYVQPKMALFVKYEFWPNYFQELKKEGIPVVIISAAFRENQSFFKWYGGFMRTVLRSVSHFFVQDEISKELLNRIGFSNVSVSGDTRFDRVSHQIEMNNKVDFISEFVGGRLCVVIGSSWKEDEEVFINYINRAPASLCFIIAPHEIKESGVASLVDKITKKTIRYSDREGKELNSYQVFVMNTIGYLSRVYSYADITYVGGAMGTSGLHNILEPATFGVPVIIGKNFDKFWEAKQLQKLAGLFSVSSQEEFSVIIDRLIDDKQFREKTGMISGHFINSNTGATHTIMTYITASGNL
ncbi:3-deoxy-D-manno-octulosonic acid transferase [Aquimarina sp. TRL1]|uniref:3-deoxy-D-manno-octulosonic acid transferase n=1 Tax=Aquimarina sp. (strain TRL1) TaxID=2736252 RepID=UPI0020CB4D42|nr:glycosyltransferase N-terminal domain-containing protein [Aquimarina sp. TRL1]